jgi:5'-deoxynucleotidase YfbR-like HD superfamily hydrolase
MRSREWRAPCELTTWRGRWRPCSRSHPRAALGAAAQVARDADKLETLLQAIEYQAQGHDTTAWQETSIAALRTETAKQLAQAITAADPQWWSAFAASYRELRASAQGRSRNLPS